jgi:hypothetical protein
VLEEIRQKGVLDDELRGKMKKTIEASKEEFRALGARAGAAG